MSTEPIQDENQTIDIGRINGFDRHLKTPTGTAARPARKNRFSPGDVLSDRFLIIRFLGSGGMGEVYQAQDCLLQDAQIALKTISANLAGLPEAQDRFEREVLLARRISHPNVCPIYHIDYHEDSQGVCCFLTMKLIYGETLAARLERQLPLTPAESTAVVCQVAAALNAAHRAQVIHRDIKPSNIMLSDSGLDIKAVVMDFGLARRHDLDETLTSTAQVMGTIGYLAPELMRGQPANSATDLYSFGVVLHQIFGGKVEDQTNDGWKLPRGIYETGVPTSVARLLAGCLSNDPQTRLQSFQHALTKLNIDSASAGDSPYTTAPYWTRRRWLVGAAALGCGLGATAVWERDDIGSLFNPLPRKRFVALVSSPPSSDNSLAPMLSGVMDAMQRELSRAEAFDHDLLVISAPANSPTTELSQLQKTLGANLMLESSVQETSENITLVMHLIDAAAARVFRTKTIHCHVEGVTALPALAVRAAAALLNVTQFVRPGGRLQPGTAVPEAYRLFQDAESLMRKPNDEGLDAAIEQYKSALEQDNSFALAHVHLALAYCRFYGIHRQPAALELAQANAVTALNLDKAFAEAHLVLGFVLQNRGNRKAAIVEMDKAIALDPTDSLALNWEARVYVELGQFKQAEESFQRVLLRRPNYWLGYLEYGELLFRQRKCQAALGAYRAANLARPQHYLPLNDIGMVYLALGQLNEARENLAKSLAISPSGLAAASLATSLRLDGKLSDALKSATNAVTLDGTDDENLLELGDCYSALGRHVEARQAYARAAEEAKQRLQTDQSDSFRWLLLALYQIKINKPVESVAALQKAESLGSNDFDSLLAKARTLELLGSRQEAIQALRTCFIGGVTKFEITSIPDLQSLRLDNRFSAIFKT